MKVVVLGLDGACFELINPWLKNGSLPNLRKLVKDGVSGPLESWPPPVTCPSWKCYSTGLNPGKLGVYWWQIVDVRRRRISIPSSRSFRGKEIWDYLAEAGFSSGVLNMPTTYPPKPIKGFMVAGGPLSLEIGYAYPPWLEERLRQMGYRVHPKERISSREKAVEAFDELLELFEMRFKVAYRLAKEFQVNFLHLTIFYINTLHHFLWDHPLVKRAWQAIDELVGWVLSAWDVEDIIIISDHGSNPIKSVFAVNAWLKREGYLRFSSGRLKGVLAKLGLTRERLGPLLARLIGEKAVSRLSSSTVPQALIPSGIGEIDWASSKALGSGQGPLYLLGTERGSEEYEKLRDELIEKLEGLRDPRTGLKVIAKAHRAEELYGSLFGPAPDIILEQSPGCHIEGSLAAEKPFGEPDKWAAENAKYGLFIAHGPDFKKGLRVEGAKITDVAPTVLCLYGLRAPTYMDGHVLVEALAPKAQKRKHAQNRG